MLGYSEPAARPAVPLGGQAGAAEERSARAESLPVSAQGLVPDWNGSAGPLRGPAALGPAPKDGVVVGYGEPASERYAGAVS